ncbi:MAG: cupredoxin domain-containing protein [Microgenomates group bacterium]
MVKNQKIILILAGLILLIVLVSGFFYFKSKKENLPSAPSSQTPIVNPTTIPTLTEEQKEIIANITTHTVKIENGKLNPETITIKVHDQVSWVNNDKEVYQIKGEDWGNVPINPGENFTQAFDKPGTFSYTCALHPQIKGTVIVKE